MQYIYFELIVKLQEKNDKNNEIFGLYLSHNFIIHKPKYFQMLVLKDYISVTL